MCCDKRGHAVQGCHAHRRDICIHRYRGDGPLAAWVKKVAASKALMKLRKHRREQLDQPLEEDERGIAPGPGSPEGRPALGAHHRMDLESALARLSDTSRAVVWLHDIEGYTHEEIAEMMERTVSFSKSQLARAHERLRELLEGAAPKNETSLCTPELKTC